MTSESERPGDVRERLAGPDGERREHRIELPVEEPGQLGELLLRAVGAGADPRPRSRRAQASAPRPTPATARRMSSSARVRIRASVSRGVSPSGPRRDMPERVLSQEPGDAHHEELVEVRGEDRAELHPLEQRHLRIGRQLEHARVEVEPGKLSVEEPRAGPRSFFDLRHGTYGTAESGRSALGLRSGALTSCRNGSGSCEARTAIEPRDVGGPRGAQVGDDPRLGLLAREQRLPGGEVLEPVEVA